MTSRIKVVASASLAAALLGGTSVANAGRYTDAETATPAVKAVSASQMMIVAGGGHYNAESSYPKMAMQPDIVDIAVSAGQFNTLAKALTEAGLIDTLKGPGPFTVFAPTDAAFAKIPADQLQALLADKSALTKVLTYHVVPGTVMAKDVRTGSVRTVEGQNLMLDVSSAGVKVNDANVIKTDIVASNGVIHVIDTVVLPN
jgi:uncharacterized surface protein with fasciclin (FAS1) repeats